MFVDGLFYIEYKSIDKMPDIIKPDVWKGFFNQNQNDERGLISDVRAPKIIYCTDAAKPD